jgi:hypothetical protein
MKLGLAIASEKALPSALVVFRNKLSNSIRKVVQLGYDGIELPLLDSSQISLPEIKGLLKQYHLELPVISTGQVSADAKRNTSVSGSGHGRILGNSVLKEVDLRVSANNGTVLRSYHAIGRDPQITSREKGSLREKSLASYRSATGCIIAKFCGRQENCRRIFSDRCGESLANRDV